MQIRIDGLKRGDLRALLDSLEKAVADELKRSKE